METLRKRLGACLSDDDQRGVAFLFGTGLCYIAAEVCFDYYERENLTMRGLDWVALALCGVFWWFTGNKESFRPLPADWNLLDILPVQVFGFVLLLLLNAIIGKQSHLRPSTIPACVPIVRALGQTLGRSWDTTYSCPL